MSNNFSRRDVLRAGAVTGAAAAFAAVAAPATASAAPQPSSYGGGREEAKELDQLYADAVQEGGGLIVYAGGDLPSSGVHPFTTAFPDVPITVIVDYSKFHDVRVTNQLATNTLVPDVVQFQTLQNFDRWKKEGALLHYKPKGFSKIHRSFRDPDGAYIAASVNAFSYMYDPTVVSDEALPTPLALTDPQWRGRIASPYPQDDDATLFLYKLYVEAYGWDWAAKMASQQIDFRRGSHTPRVALTAGEKAVGLGSGGSLIAPTARVKWVAPQGAPFMAWGQRYAILRQARHPAAAKLYMNWQLSEQRQSTAGNGWSVRTDVTPNGGLAPIWTYPNANLDGFPAFMADRGEAERWRRTFDLYFGEVTGPPTPGVLGLHPGA